MKKFLIFILLLSFTFGYSQSRRRIILHNLENGTPILSNFYVDDTNTDRVYFDSSESITATTVTGFTISGKTISSITINSGTTSGHYFTVSSAFTFWDNNTIKYEGGSNIQDLDSNGVYDFTLTYINNNIDEPTGTGDTYYVDAATGDDTDTGLTEALAWATIDKATSTATAGDIVYIKVGNYGNENVVVDNSGTVSEPIKFIGYKTTPGDITSNYYTPLSDNWSTSEMPTITGSSRTSNYGINSTSKDYIIFKNIQASTYADSFRNYTSENVVFERCNAYNNDYGFASYGDFTDSNQDTYVTANVRVSNCRSKNSAVTGIGMFGSHNFVENTTYYCSDTGTPNSTDYYIVFRGNNNIAIGNYMERVTNDHGGYFGFKSETETYANKTTSDNVPTRYNLADDNDVINITRALKARNVGCDYNVFKNNFVDGELANRESSTSGTGSISIFGGVKGNIWENNIIKRVSTMIEFYANSEGVETSRVAEGNIIRNNIFNQAYYFIYSYNAHSTAIAANDNEIYNNTIYNVVYNHRLLNIGSPNYTYSGNEYKNNIFHTVTNKDNTSSAFTVTSGMFSYDYNNFYNGYTATGTNQNTTNPNFVNTTDFVPQTTLSAPKLTNVDYDYNNEERESTTTIGAQCSTTE